MPTVSSHSIVMKDAIGPDAVSRNHSRAAPRPTNAVMTCRKKASIRTSMKRALLAARERDQVEVVRNIGAADEREHARRGLVERQEGHEPALSVLDAPNLEAPVGGERPRPLALPGPREERRPQATLRHKVVPRGDAHRLEAVDDVCLHRSGAAPGAPVDSAAVPPAASASLSLSVSSIADSKSSPRSSPISRPIFFMNRAALAGSFSSRSPKADESASDSRRASSDFTVAKRDITRLKLCP